MSKQAQCAQCQLLVLLLKERLSSFDHNLYASRIVFQLSPLKSLRELKDTMHFSSVYQGTVSHLFEIYEIIEVFSDFVMFVYVHVCV